MKKKTKLLLSAAAVILLLAIGVLLLFVLKTDRTMRGYALYAQDGTLYYNGLDGVLFDLTEYSMDASFGETQLHEVARAACADAAVFGDRLFYTMSDALYLRDITRSDAVPVLIAETVTKHRVSADGAYVLYTDTSKTLCRYRVKDGDVQEIENNVISFEITDDGKNAVYITQTEEGKRAYRKRGDKSAEEVPVGIYEFTQDMRYLLCLQYEYTINVTMVDENGQTTSFGNCISASDLYETGTFYYLKEDDTGIPGDQIFIDDLDDSELSQKMRELYLHRNTDSYSLHYFDGKQDICLTEKVPIVSYRAAAEHDAVVFKAFTEQSERIPLSLFTESAAMLNKELSRRGELFVAVGGTVINIPSKHAENITISAQGDRIAYLCGGDLYEAELQHGKPMQAVFRASDISEYYLRFLENGELFYLKKTDNPLFGELFVGDKQIAADVYLDFNKYTVNGNRFAYMTDVDDSKHGTLWVYDGKNATNVADRVWMDSVTLTPDGRVLYQTDVDSKTQKGDLHVFDGTNQALVAKDVHHYQREF